MRSFGEDGAGIAMIRSIAVLATELGLSIIAEGIEHDDPMRALQELGTSMGQGQGLLTLRSDRAGVAKGTGQGATRRLGSATVFKVKPIVRAAGAWRRSTSLGLAASR